MSTKTVHSRFNKNIGDTVEGHRIIEKTVIAQPVKSFDPEKCRDGIYDYLVEVAPIVVKLTPKRGSDSDSIRATPEEMGGRVIRRVKN